MGNVFSHSGDIGDLLAALPVIRQMGGGELVLFPAECTGRRMTRDRFDGLRAFLELQPYLTAVRYADGPAGVNLDHWRHHYRGHLNLTDMAAEAFGQPHPDRERPWLRVDRPDRVAQVLFARSHRYRNPRVDWPAVYRAYADEAVFVGTPDEHHDFVRAFGPVGYHYTRDYLRLARAVAGADLVAVNQTSIRWLTEGFKVPVLVEVDPDCNNTHWQREGAYYLYGGPDLPTLDRPEELAVRAAVRPARGPTTLDDGQLTALARLARRVRQLGGLTAEAGGAAGGSAAVIAACCPEKRLRLFGAGAAADGARELLQLYDVEYVAGPFPSAAPDNARYALAHLVWDGELGAADGLRHFALRLSEGGVLAVSGPEANAPAILRAAAALGLTAFHDPASGDPPAGFLRLAKTR